MSYTGLKIRELRKAAGMTQTELAERLGVTKATVSSWETGNRVPTVGGILKLTGLFDVSSFELLEPASGEKQDAAGAKDGPETTQTEPRKNEPLTNPTEFPVWDMPSARKYTVTTPLGVTLNEDALRVATVYADLDSFGKAAVNALIYAEKARCDHEKLLKAEDRG